ncbi:MAG: lamin tail domain-containing protein [Polyangia bacterium]|jgi:hypothetical protein|nr:lamin tail domain-containing protein [Polyangia bacterium]
MTRKLCIGLVLPLTLLAACGRGYGVQPIEQCGNGQREGQEQCDGPDLGLASCATLGLGGGTLACTASCAFDTSECSLQAVCGNGVLEYPETCDSTDLAGETCESLGLGSGVLACSSVCSFDTLGCGASDCGDLLISGSEVCDGTNLGEASCRSLGFYGGELACESDCSALDTSDCSGRCGDGILDGPEVCDGQSFGADSCQARGFYSGSLVCSSDCQAVDPTGCAGFCGDGLINGSEACDGAAVGGDSCEAHGLTGNLQCLPDCSAVNLASCHSDGLLITEIGLGNPDWAEILNRGSQDVDLAGWSLAWWGVDQNNQAVTGVLDLPAFTLAAGARVAVLDEYGGDPTAPPTVDAGAGTITFHVNIWWGDIPGAVALLDPYQVPVDFARWGSSTIDPPSGTSWADTPLSLLGTNRDDITLSRVPDAVDTDVAGDFCRAPASRGAANNECHQAADPGAILITEVHDAQPTDRVELYNPGASAINLAGFLLYATNGSGTTQALPSFVLGPGQYVAVIDDSTVGPWVDGPDIHVGNLNIAPAAGVVILMDAATNAGVDFVRWGTIAVDPVAPDTWADTPAAIGSFPTNPPTPRSLGRQSLTDTNTAGDFCYMEVTVGSANTACVP